MKNKKNMKTIGCSVCIGMFLSGMLFSHAQIKVTGDGGVKMGVPPTSEVSGTSWRLPEKGLEVNLGEIRLYAANGAGMFFKGVSAPKRTAAIDVGGPIVGTVSPKEYAALTGTSLQIGLINSLVWAVNTQSLYSATSIRQGSDRRMKQSVRPIVDAKSYVMRLQPVTYDLLPREGFNGDSAELKNKAGFIAQDVLEVLPGAVGYMEEIDRYSLDYSHFIPYLTQTVQEQEHEIQMLKDQLRESEERLRNIEERLYLHLGEQGGNGIMRVDRPEENDDKEAEETKSLRAKLYQNAPNPVKESTLVRYELPDERQAELVISSVNGQVVRTCPLPRQRGAGEIEIPARVLGAGVYNCSLFVGKIRVDTKRMVVTD